MKPNKPVSVLCLMLAALIWGTAFSAQKLAVEAGVGNFLFTATRFFIGALVLLPVVLIFCRKRLNFRKTVPASLLAGAVLFFASNLQQFGIDLSGSAGKASFLTGLYLILVPFAERFLLGKKLKKIIWLAAFLALIGIYLICVKPGESVGIGDLLLILGAFFWTAHILVVGRGSTGTDPLVFSMLQFFFAGLFSAVASVFFEGFPVITLTYCLGPLAYAGVLSSGVAYTCQVVGQRGIKPSRASILLSSESLIGAVSGVLVNGEEMTLNMVLGGIILFSAIILSQLPSSGEIRAQTGKAEGD